MFRFAVAALFLTALPGFAQDATLTQKELDAGWFLLFDGETTFGWTAAKTSKGTAEVDKGVLTLDPAAGPVSLDCNTHFGSFELSLDYRLEPAAKGKTKTAAAAGLTITRPTKKETIPFIEATEKKNDWVQFGFRLEYFPNQKNFQHVRTYAQDRSVFHSTAGYIAGGAPASNRLGLVASPGVKVQVRNIRIRPRNPDSLFNGKDLTGWKVFPDKKSVFKVEDGAINVKDGPGDLQTTQKFGDFLLQLECFSHGKHLNSGVFFRCRAGEYQNGYEAQIRNQFNETPQEYTVENYDPATHQLIDKTKVMSPAVDYGTGAIYRRMPARKALAEDGKWFAMTIVAHKNHFATWVNGIQQVDWTDNRPVGDNARTGCRLEAGHISLQGHDPTTNLSFRSFRIAKVKQ